MLYVLGLIDYVKCLLNECVICVGELIVFSLKIIVLWCWLIRVLCSNVYVCDPSVCV